MREEGGGRGAGPPHGIPERVSSMHVVITTDTPGQAMVLCSHSSKSNGPRHSPAGPGAAAPEHALSELVSVRPEAKFCFVFEMLRSYMLRLVAPCGLTFLLDNRLCQVPTQPSPLGGGRGPLCATPA